MKRIGRILSAVLAAALIISCFAAPAVTAASANISAGTYYICSKLNTSKVIDVDNAGTADGTNVQLYDKNGTTAQQFKITKNGSYYKITCVCSGKVLDIAGGSAASGTNVQQYYSNNSDAQKWEFIDAGGGYYYIKSALGTYLDVSGGKTANGTNIQAYRGNGTDSQKWKLVSTAEKYVVNHPNGLNVRSKASTSGNILGVAANGTSFTVSSVSGNWGYTSSIKTLSGTKAGWVCLDYAKKADEKSSSKTSISISLSNISTTQGTGQHLNGTVKSSGSKLKKISAKISGTKYEASVSVSANSYKLYDSDIDWKLPIGSLAAGSYTLTVTATAADGATASKSAKITVNEKKTSDNSEGTANVTLKGSFSGKDYSNMKVYPGKNYSNYYVVKNYNSEYLYNQYDYDKYILDGSNQGCTAVSVCMAVNMTKGKKVLDPETYGGWVSTGENRGCTWDYCNEGGHPHEKETYLRDVASYLVKGKAVAMYANNSHMVCAIGIKNGADLNNLAAKDILIADPATKEVTTLNKAGRGGYVANKWRFYTAK